MTIAKSSDRTEDWGSRVTVPHAVVAERALAGAAILAPYYADRISDALDLADVYDRRLRAVLAACADLADVDRITAGSTEADWRPLAPQLPPITAHVRAAAAATMTDLPFVVVHALLDEASCAVDRDMGRVHAAAQARARLVALDDEREALTKGWAAA